MTISSLSLGKQDETVSQNNLTVWPENPNARINHLPLDVITKVVSFLDKSEIPELVKTCRDLTDKGAQAVKCLRIGYLTDCIDRLELLGEVPRVLRIFKKIYANSTNIQELAGINRLLTCIKMEKGELAESLRYKDESTSSALGAIKEVEPCPFFDVMQTITYSHSMVDNSHQSDAYYPGWQLAGRDYSFESTFFKGLDLKDVSIHFARGGMFDWALELGRSLRAPYAKCDTLVNIAKSLFKAGDSPKALDLLEEVRSIAKTIDVSTVKNEKLFIVARAFLKAGRPDLSYKLLSEDFQEIDYSYGIITKCKILENITEDFMKNGDTHRAFESLGEAREVARFIPYRSGEIQMVIEIANLFLQEGDQNRAYELLLEATESIDSVSDHISKSEFQRQIAKGLLQIGDNDRAFATLQRAVEIIRSIPKGAVFLGSSKCEMLFSIAEVFLESGMVDEAQQLLLEVCEAIDSASLSLGIKKYQLLRKIAQVFSQIGDENRALSVLAKAEGISHARQPNSIFNMGITTSYNYLNPAVLFQ